jgi:hypothetical protein
MVFSASGSESCLEAKYRAILTVSTRPIEENLSRREYWHVMTHGAAGGVLLLDH